ncbi:MAG: type III pantothenate kinase [Anaerolineae bacterium]
MILTIDVGNTNTMFGLYNGATLTHHWRIKTDRDRMPDEYGITVVGFFRHEGCDPAAVKGIAMASVVPPLTKIFTRMCERYFGQFPLLVEPGIKTGIKIEVDNPASVGADRIVDALATHHLYGGPACIVDLGTATTFDAVSQEGNYIGGAIAPGVIISADALFMRTAKLPRVELVPPPSVIGRNTVQAIQSGLVYGYTGLIEGVVARFRAELGDDMKVIATGGLARTFAEQTTVIDHINPWLTLEGLRIVWLINNGGFTRETTG